MFGNDVVTICPFCNKTIYENLGGVSYYNYNDGQGIIENVRIDNHCGKDFITVDRPAPELIPSRYIVPNYVRHWVDRVSEVLFDEPIDEIKKKDIDTLTNDVISVLKDKYGEDEVNHDLGDIKTLIQIMENQLHISVFAIPLTDEVKKSLIYSHAVCW